MTDIRVSETRIHTALGDVYAKVWTGNANSAPVILLHDSLGCVDLWRDFPGRLSSALGRTVVAYDRIGFGKSTSHPGRLNLSFVHDEARSTFKAVVDHFSFDRFVVFGHSVGGGMAVEIAAQFPSACQALITESAQAFVEDRTLEGIRQAQREFARPGQVERLGKYHGDKAAWVLSAWIDSWLSPGFADWSLDLAARGVICPFLAIHGENDEYGSTAHPSRIASQVKGLATTKILPGCGHVPHREVPDVVLETAAALLAPIQ